MKPQAEESKLYLCKVYIFGIAMAVVVAISIYYIVDYCYEQSNQEIKNQATLKQNEEIMNQQRELLREWIQIYEEYLQAQRVRRNAV